MGLSEDGLQVGTDKLNDLSFLFHFSALQSCCKKKTVRLSKLRPRFWVSQGAAPFPLTPPVPNLHLIRRKTSRGQRRKGMD